MADIAKRRITELSKAAVVLPDDDIIILQNGRSLKATVSQLTLASVDVSVDAIEGLQDLLDDKVDYTELDEKSDKNHKHVIDDVTDASEFSKNFIRANGNAEATNLLNTFDAENSGIVPNFVAGDEFTVLTSQGWKNRNVGTHENSGLAVSFSENSGFDVSLDLANLEQAPEPSSDIDYILPIYHQNSQTHYKHDLSIFARKIHKHTINDIDLLSTELDKRLEKANNLSDVADADTALGNIGGTEIGKGVFKSKDTDEVLEHIGLKSGKNNINVYSIADAPIGVERNLLLNGSFRYWPRGYSISGLGHNAAGWRTKVYSGNSTGSITVSRGNFSLGYEGIEGTPISYMRLTGSNFNSNDLFIETFIEDVATLSEKDATLSFWIRSGALRNVRCYITQNFGTGGTPSSEVRTMIIDNQVADEDWTKIVVPFTMPTIQGKIMGSNENSSYIKLGICLREGNFGIALGTSYVDITQAQLEPGPNATIFEPRPIWLEEQFYSRYFQRLDIRTKNYASENNQQIVSSGSFAGHMRTVPTVKITERVKNNIQSALVFPKSSHGYDVNYDITSLGLYESDMTVEFSSEFLND